MTRKLLVWTAFVAMLFATHAHAVEQVIIVGLFKDKALLKLDGKQRLLRAGETSPEGVTLVSANSDAAVLEVNGKRSNYALGQQIGSDFSSPDQPSVSIWQGRYGMYEVTGSINGFTVAFIVDTGATLVSMSAREARRLGLDYRRLGKRSYSSTASGISQVFILTLDKVKVGDIELRNVAAAVHDGDFPQTTLLGMSFLGQLDMHRRDAVLELRKKF